PVDAFEQGQVDAADTADLGQPTIRVPDKSIGIVEGADGGCRRTVSGKVRRDGFERADDPCRSVIFGSGRTFCRGRYGLAGERFCALFSILLCHKRFLTVKPYRAFPSAASGLK